MADQFTTSPTTPANAQRRRLSIVDMFTSRPTPTSASTNSSSPPSAGTPVTPEVPQHRRGVSISSMGLAGSGPGQSSPFNAFARQRAASISTSSAASSPEFKNSFGDGAVIEEDDQDFGSPPSPSFARRVSFGTQALKDVKGGGVGIPTGGRRPSSSLYTLTEDSDHPPNPPSRYSGTAKAPGEGFNWSEALRDRTKRSPSFSTGNPFTQGLGRTKLSGAAPVPEPPKEMPKAAPTPTRMKKPDHLGERMLRGDFMMD